MTVSGTTDGVKRRERLDTESNRPKTPKVSRGTASSAESPDPEGAAHKVGGAHISLIRSLAHDLRNPISGIRAASQCLLEDAVPFLDRPQITLLRAIETSSDLMLQLIEDMLEMARADSERLRLRLRPTDVTKLVEESLVKQRGQAAARDIRLNVTCAADGSKVKADTLKLRWTLNALLANIIRSSGPGGEIEIHIASQRKNIAIVLRYTSDGHSARTADERGSSGRRWRQQASALTVAAARLIVKRHGGTIRVDHRTTPPTFTMTLPRLEAGKVEGTPLRRAASG